MHSNSPITPAAVRSLAYDASKPFPLHPRVHSPSTPPSGFSDSSYPSSSSFASSSRRGERYSRPSTSSGPAVLNSGMKHLLSSSSPKEEHHHHHHQHQQQQQQRKSFYPQLQPSAPAQPPRPPAWPVVIQLEEAPQEELELPRTDSDTFDLRMDRIESWRTTSLCTDNYDNETSSSSQRSGRLNTSTTRHKTVTQYRCTACDSSYASRQSLKRHAQGVRTNHACRTAVEYFLE